MSTKIVRDHYRDIITTAIPSGVTITIEGDVYEPKLTTVGCRIKVLAAEPEHNSVGVYPSMVFQGLVQIDLMVARAKGLSTLQTVADTIISALDQTSVIIDNTKLITSKVWEDTVSEEAVYLRKPIMIRWYLVSS